MIRLEGVCRCCVLVLLLMVGLGSLSCTNEEGMQMIEIQSEGERVAIKNEEIHFKELDLAAGEFLHVTVWQHEIDVGLRLRGPGSIELYVDSPHGRVGEEELLLITSEAGLYRIEVEGPRKKEAAGHFTLETRTRQPPSARDRELAATDAAYRGAREVLKSDPAQSVKRLRDSLGILEKYGLEGREAMLVETLAGAYDRRGEVEVALVFFDRAVALYERAGEKYKRGLALNQLALRHQRFGRVEKALGLFQESLQLFEEIGGAREQVHLMVQVGIAQQRLGALQEALEWFERAAVAAEEGALESTNFAKIATAKGSVYLSLNQGEEALRVYRDALEIYRQSGDERRVAQTLVNLADVALRRGEMEKAGVHAMEAIEVLRTLEKSLASRDLARAYLLFGRIEARQGQAVAARKAFGKALQSARGVSDRSLEATLVLELGRLSYEEGHSEDAVEIFEKALTSFEEIGERTGQAPGPSAPGRFLARPWRSEEGVGVVRSFPPSGGRDPQTVAPSRFPSWILRLSTGFLRSWHRDSDEFVRRLIRGFIQGGEICSPGFGIARTQAGSHPAG